MHTREFLTSIPKTTNRTVANREVKFSFQSISALTYPGADTFLPGALAQLQPRTLGHSWRIFTDAVDACIAEHPAQLQMEKSIFEILFNWTHWIQWLRCCNYNDLSLSVVMLLCKINNGLTIFQKVVALISFFLIVTIILSRHSANGTSFIGKLEIIFGI